MQRIAFLALTLTMTAVAAVPKGNADNYPSRPIRLIVGFPPGSAADITARLVGDVMSGTLGQQVVVEVRPGAGSSIAAEYVARSPADGYTLFMGTLSNVTNAVTSSNLPFDFVKDFAPVAPLTGLPLILAVHPSLGVSSVDALIVLARSKPGELTYGSVGPGTVGGHAARGDRQARRRRQRRAQVGGRGLQAYGVGVRPPDMSNFCCLPGRAGGTPILV